MTDHQKHRVYLAGPISGCNEIQIHEWRQAVGARFGHLFEFVDPARDVLPRAGIDYDDYEIVVRDQQDIARSDGVLANMWKESIGTALGVFHAAVQGKPVVVVDPNRLENRILSHYANAVVANLDRGMEVLSGLLHDQHAVGSVEKRAGRVEPFRREKLTLSIRHACLSAGRNDMLAAAEIVPEVLRRLGQHGRQGTVRSRMIRDTVWEVLQELEADPLRAGDYAGIRKAWEDHVHHKPAREKPVKVREVREVMVHGTPREVVIRADKSHTTIWGVAVRGLGDLPGGARRVFAELMRVDGIARVSLHLMRDGPKVERCALELLASKTAGRIEGKCHDEGPKGRVQLFQLVLDTKDPNETDAIRQTLLRHLDGLGMIFKSHREQHRLAEGGGGASGGKG